MCLRNALPRLLLLISGIRDAMGKAALKVAPGLTGYYMPEPASSLVAHEPHTFYFLEIESRLQVDHPLPYLGPPSPSTFCLAEFASPRATAHA